MAKHDALIAEVRERFDLAGNFWRDIRGQRRTDLRYVSGDPWSDTDRNARQNAGRPCLSLDELGQYFNQVINDVRANPRAVKFSPTGNGANDKAAEFYQNKMREIEYRSGAQIAYTTAFQNAVEGSYGWVRLRTKHERKGFNQELWIEDIPNPDMILSDPDAVRPDSSDMKYLFLYETWTHDEFRRQYPDAEVTDFTDLVTDAPAWVKDKQIVLAEYWRVTSQKRDLLMIQPPPGVQEPPMSIFADEMQAMPNQGIVIAKREVEWPVVTQYLTNGVEILKETPTLWEAIPFASCFGKRIYVDEGSGPKLQILSMTRLARDPYMLYCYYRTAQAEVVGMTPKTPYIGYVGQFRTRQTEWQGINHTPQAFLEADPFTEATGQQVLPLPQRQPYDPPIERLEIGAEGARRAIQSAMGTSPLPSSAQRRNEKSGKALKQIEEQSQRGSYHFIDGYENMIRRVGELCEQAIPWVYDTARDVGVMLPMDKSATVRINDPKSVDPKTGQPNAISTKGDYQVTISTGPNFDSERIEASEFADTLVASPLLPLIAQMSGPPAAAKLTSLAIKLKNLGPIGDEMADTISPDPNEQNSPEAMAKQFAAMQQQLQQAMQIVQQLQQDQATDKIKAERDVALNAQKQQSEDSRTAAEIQAENERTALKVAADERKAALDNLVKLAIAEINAQNAIGEQHAEMVRDEMGFKHQHATKAMELGAKSQEGDKDRSAQIYEGERSRGSEAVESERGRQFEREEGDVARAHEADQAERARQADAEAAQDDGA